MRNQLLLISSSIEGNQRKLGIPLLEWMDDPVSAQFRQYLHDRVWPTSLSVGVLFDNMSVAGALFTPNSRTDFSAPISAECALQSADTLLEWMRAHAELVADQALIIQQFAQIQPELMDVIDERRSSIGVETSPTELQAFLRSLPSIDRRTPLLSSKSRPYYFLPDWEDMLDADYDFVTDTFSRVSRADRREVHSVAAMQPHRVCDGVLVSLAQHLPGGSGKGMLRSYGQAHLNSLAPPPLRDHFGLKEDQWLFGDCGAFSYVGMNEPPITPDLALSLYHIYGFDFGASVDHIPMSEVPTKDGRRKLSDHERRARVRLTKQNAQEFIEKHHERGYSFAPVGVIQGLSPRSFRYQFHEYLEMGYQHIGLGGLIPLQDREIVEIVREVSKARDRLGVEPWIHLFGVYRPKIQVELRRYDISSFDSATYFRKAWLRSGQNYLSPSGTWYSALRVPVLNDPRTRKRLEGSNLKLDQLEQMEQRALGALIEYGSYRETLENTLETVLMYDALLKRNSVDQRVRAKYEQTLLDRPWEHCDCPVCQSLGIHVVIFRGYNRNKRRGIHNTKMLYSSLTP